MIGTIIAMATRNKLGHCVKNCFKAQYNRELRGIVKKKDILTVNIRIDGVRNYEDTKKSSGKIIKILKTSASTKYI
jgi:hypothetical protein